LRSERLAARGRYTRTAILLHWLVAALVLAQFAWGWAMQAIPKEPHGPRVDAFNLHKSVGLLILALMLVRLAGRLAHPAPPLQGLPRWQARAARATHGVLYAALFMMPLAGYLGSAWSGYPVKGFGVTLPAWAAAHPALKALMSDVHLGTSLVLAAVGVLHLAAAARHALRRDGYLTRMWPVVKARPAAGPRARRRAGRGAASTAGPRASARVARQRSRA
jgi:cytochrome b561